MSKRYANNTDADTDSSGKKWNLCTHIGCGYRGTHSDSPGGKHSKCGLHYYAASGEDAIKEWQARNELAIVDVQRVYARLSKYVGMAR